MSRQRTTGRRVLAASLVLLGAAGIFLRWSGARRDGTARSPAAPEPAQAAPAPPSAPPAAALEHDILDAAQESAGIDWASPEAPSQLPELPPAEKPKEDPSDPHAFLLRRTREGYGSLRVEVVDAVGAAASRAKVEIHRAAICGVEPSTRSHQRVGGNVALFEDLAPGDWHVVAEFNGQVHVETLVEPDRETRVLVRTDAGLTLAGKVRHPAGARLQDLCVTAVSEIGCGTVQIDVAADGTFRMDGLCTGPWRCHAGSRGWGQEHQGWGGGALSPADPVPFANSRSVLVTRSRDDLELVVRRAASLSGRFVGSNISPHFGVAINRASQHRYALRCDHEGFTVAGLDPGPYMLVGTNAEGWGVLDGIQVDEESALTDLEVAIEPAAFIKMSLPSELARTSVRMNGVLLPDELTMDGLLVTREVPAGQLEVEMRLEGAREVKTIEALAGQTVTLAF